MAEDWIALARELAPGFAARAAVHDADDSFVAENYAELRGRKMFSAGVPAELGGGGGPCGRATGAGSRRRPH